MRYKITFRGKTKVVEGEQPQTALNNAFFGYKEYKQTSGMFGEEEIQIIHNPVFKLPTFKIRIINSKGDVWKQKLCFCRFTSAGNKPIKIIK